MQLFGRNSWINPMIPIFANQVTQEISDLFDITKPTTPRAFNVLEGITRGQILVDDLKHPTWAVVREAVYGTLYFGGQITPSLISSLVEKFRGIGEVGIGCWLNDELNDMLPSSPDYDGRALYFTERAANYHLPKIQLPSGYTLATRDRSLLEQSFDYESTVNSFTIAENVMRHTLGVVILHDAKVVCEAATGAPTHGQIEVGVTTHESHRQRELATIACAHLIEKCELQGYKTWWDCARQNIPSIRLAHKLGYQNGREYRYVWWQK
jgi:RimJ/RimL family protein N-acetyltransferase